ncbi:hypothetical protein [Dyadobacter sp. BHUBP1]|uniref:hypothetical protein n=1 Tax=Dyadobacter sp. BHUBP1 TaxID=3424178 RepID=UPI003D3345E4
MSEGKFKLDRTAFHAGTHSETEKYYAKNQPKTLKERLEAAHYLNSIAFQFDLQNPPRMDRSVFSMRKHPM